MERQVEKPTVQCLGDVSFASDLRLMERLEEVPQVEVRENIIEAM